MSQGALCCFFMIPCIVVWSSSRVRRQNKDDKYCCVCCLVRTCVLQFQAQKYQALLDEVQDKRLQLKLAELFLNEQGLNALIDTLRGKQRAAGEKNDQLVSREQALKTCKKEHGRRNREQQHLEKEIRCV